MYVQAKQFDIQFVNKYSSLFITRKMSHEKKCKYNYYLL
jgi:hypothetical protein